MRRRTHITEFISKAMTMLSEHLLHEDEPWYPAVMIALSVSGTLPRVYVNGY